MNRRHASHVAGLLALAAVVRMLLFDHVGVWGDAGFYTYDAMLIAEGQTPFLDFIGRSPLFNYSYAAFSELVGRGIVSLRAFIITWWLLAGIPVYLLARKIHSHGAGLAALALLSLSPFMLIYSFWANTQSLAAVLAASAICVILYRRDWVGYATAGVLLGGAFLTRRSVIVICGALGLYVLYLGYREHDIGQTVRRSLASFAGFVATLTVGYLLLAQGDLALAGKFVETHAWGLISSSGRGGFPLIAEGAPDEPMNSLASGRTPIFNDLCQLCGAWTAKVFVKTVLLSVVAVAPLLYYVRDWFERGVPHTLHWWTGAGALAILSYASLRAIQAGYVLRIGAVVGLVLIGYVVIQTDLPATSVLYGREIVLPLLVLVALAVGYLYRNRLIHTYYFADFMPFVAVVAGVLYAHLWREVRT